MNICMESNIRCGDRSFEGRKKGRTVRRKKRRKEGGGEEDIKRINGIIRKQKRKK